MSSKLPGPGPRAFASINPFAGQQEPDDLLLREWITSVATQRTYDRETKKTEYSFECAFEKVPEVATEQALIINRKLSDSVTKYEEIRAQNLFPQSFGEIPMLCVVTTHKGHVVIILKSGLYESPFPKAKAKKKEEDPEKEARAIGAKASEAAALQDLTASSGDSEPLADLEAKREALTHDIIPETFFSLGLLLTGERGDLPSQREMEQILGGNWASRVLFASPDYTMLEPLGTTKKGDPFRYKIVTTAILTSEILNKLQCEAQKATKIVDPTYCSLDGESKLKTVKWRTEDQYTLAAAPDTNSAISRMLGLGRNCASFPFTLLGSINSTFLLGLLTHPDYIRDSNKYRANPREVITALINPRPTPEKIEQFIGELTPNRTPPPPQVQPQEATSFTDRFMDWLSSICEIPGEDLEGALGQRKRPGTFGGSRTHLRKPKKTKKRKPINKKRSQKRKSHKSKQIKPNK